MTYSRRPLDLGLASSRHEQISSRQRVLTALDHRQPDRAPIGFGGHFSSMHVDAHRKLKKYVGLQGGPEIIRNYFVYQVLPDERPKAHFHSNVVFFEPGPASNWQLKIDPLTNSFCDE